MKRIENINKMKDDSLMDCSFFNDKGNLIITESTNLGDFLKE